SQPRLRDRPTPVPAETSYLSYSEPEDDEAETENLVRRIRNDVTGDSAENEENEQPRRKVGRPKGSKTLKFGDLEVIAE
ncbi:hypothetical protein BGX26_009505, partial [Mortierella sp. AD094]